MVLISFNGTSSTRAPKRHNTASSGTTARTLLEKTTPKRAEQRGEECLLTPNIELFVLSREWLENNYGLCC